MKLNKSLLFLISLLTLSSCGGGEPFKYHGYNCVFLNDPDIGFFAPFNSYVAIDTYSDKQFEFVKENAQERILYAHKITDRYHDFTNFSNLKTINDSYGTGKAIKVNEELFSLVKFAKEFTILSQGKFHLALGSVIDVWKDKFDYPGTFEKDVTDEFITKALTAVPSLEELDQVIVLDEQNKTIQLNGLEGALEPVKISLGGIAKGFGLDYISKMYQGTKFKDSKLDAGSSSIMTMGDYPGVASDTWSIKYRNPSFKQDKDEFLLRIKFNGSKSLSTSGDSEQNYLIKDNAGNIIIRHHILDSETGYSNNYHRFVGLISEGTSGMLLDALSTAIFNIQKTEDIQKFVSLVNETYHVDINYFVTNPYQGDLDKFELILNSGMNSYLDRNSLAKEIVKTTII